MGSLGGLGRDIADIGGRTQAIEERMAVRSPCAVQVELSLWLATGTRLHDQRPQRKPWEPQLARQQEMIATSALNHNMQYSDAYMSSASKLTCGFVLCVEA